MSDQSIIHRLGGAKVVGDKLRDRGVKVEDVTVRSWTLDGRTVPARYWAHIVAIAAEAGVAISLETLAQAVAA
jgi:hypothetical protein